MIWKAGAGLAGFGAMAALVALLAACASDGGPPPAPTTAVSGLFRITAERGVNVRQSPSGDSPVIGVMAPGEVRKVVAVAEGQEFIQGSGNVTWYRLEGGGYVYSPLVQKVEE